MILTLSTEEDYMFFGISLKFLSGGFPFASSNGPRNLSLRKNHPLLRFGLDFQIYPFIYIYMILKYDC